MSREMKHSGIEWIGEIPEGWDVVKIGFLFENLDSLRKPISAEQRERNNPQYDYYGASGIIDKIDYFNVDDEVLLIGEDGANLVMRNLPLVYKAKGRFWVNNHAHILKPICCDYNYMSHVLEATDYRNYITGSAQPKLSQENLQSIKLPVPPLPEQQRIADYLDKVCGEIDSLVALQEAMIDELKAYKQSVITEAVTRGLNPNVPLKPSGIDWIGDIPEHWDLSMLKRLLTFQNGQDYKHVENDCGYPVYGSGGIFRFATGYLYDGESILFGRKGTIDKPLYVEGKFWTVDTMYYTIPLSGNNCKFLFYEATLLPFGKYQTSTALPSMTQTILGGMMVVVPPLSEQQQIANYLDTKCSEIDSLIAIKQNKIEELKEYKKSIIYEYVTGKKEVV